MKKFFSFFRLCFHPIKSLTLLSRNSKTEMRFSTFALLVSTVTAVNAHFELAFPGPRGVFDDDNEVNFCGNVSCFLSIRVLISAADNYINAVENRTEFPISGGYVTLSVFHPTWSRTSE
jgi:hypothetical protein